MKHFLFTILSLVTITISSCISSTPTTKLHYLIREPKIKSIAPPLIVLLHGVGSNEEDLFSFANNLPDRFLVVSARGPQTLGHGSYGWYHLNVVDGKFLYDKTEAEKARLAIIEFLHDLKAVHLYDASQVYLCGFSQGSIMSLSVALTRPDLIKGIAIMSGRILDEIKPQIKKGPALNNLRIFISHGTNDPVINVSLARNCFQFLKENNLYPEYHEYPEQHTISNAMFHDMISWLNK